MQHLPFHCGAVCPHDRAVFSATRRLPSSTASTVGEKPKRRNNGLTSNPQATLQPKAGTNSSHESYESPFLDGDAGASQRHRLRPRAFLCLA